MASTLSCRLRQALTASDLQDCINSRFYAPSIIVRAKVGHDDFADNRACERVGKNPFEAVADLDAQLAIVLRNHEDSAVVETFLTNLPGFRDPDAEALDVFTL